MTGELALVSDAPSKREMDYLMIAVFARMQHGREAEARTLIDGVLAAGVETPELLFAKAVVENNTGNFEAALGAVRRLEVLEPAASGIRGKALSRTRMRSYIYARAIFGLTGELDEAGRAALDFYLRQSRKKRKPT